MVVINQLLDGWVKNELEVQIGHSTVTRVCIYIFIEQLHSRFPPQIALFSINYALQSVQLMGKCSSVLVS